MVFFMLSIPTLALLASTSTYNRLVVRHHIFRRSRSLVRSFVPVPENLFRVLRWTRSALSGSSIFQFLVPDTGSFWNPNDLDIYVPSHKAGMESHVVNFLLFEGYNIITTIRFNNGPNQQPYDNFGGITSVVKMGRGSQMIDVIHTRSPTFFSCISRFHLTAVMNFMSADGIFSAYPSLTDSAEAIASRLAFRTMLHPSDSLVAAYRKYQARGLKIFNVHPTVTLTPSYGQLPRHRCRQSFVCPHTIRTTFDGGCLFVPFVPDDGSAITPTRCTRGFYNLESGTVWMLGGRSCDGSYFPIRSFSSVEGMCLFYLHYTSLTYVYSTGTQNFP